MLCYIAGDDNCGIAGRILTIGYDLWAHIGCLLFVSHVKRCWDYIVLKVRVTKLALMWEVRAIRDNWRVFYPIPCNAAREGWLGAETDLVYFVNHTTLDCVCT